MAKQKKPIPVNSAIQVDIKGFEVHIQGPKGEMKFNLPVKIETEMADNLLKLSWKEKSVDPSLMGLSYALVKNAVIGVSEGFTKTLEMVGVGYRASTDGTKLTLNVGFSHPVDIVAPEGISFKVEESKIIVSGINKYSVGEVSAQIRRVKPPEPYKGKGIRYLGEKIKKKAGKAAKTVGGMGAK